MFAAGELTKNPRRRWCAPVELPELGNQQLRSEAERKPKTKLVGSRRFGRKCP